MAFVPITKINPKGNPEAITMAKDAYNEANIHVDVRSFDEIYSSVEELTKSIYDTMYSEQFLAFITWVSALVIDDSIKESILNIFILRQVMSYDMIFNYLFSI